MIDLLVLTSCIRPPKQKFLKLNDTEARYSQTIQCVKSFLNSNSFKRIVLCDGSNFDFNDSGLIEYASKFNTELEILSFSQDFDKVAELGKGYGEGQIMEYIVKHSKLFNSSSFFLKVTGRLFVENINSIAQDLDTNKIYFNIFPSKYIGCVDTRVYAMPTMMYVDKFKMCYTYVNDSQHHSYEFCFTDVIKCNKLMIKYFPKVPRICGVSGTNNKPYHPDCVYYTECILTRLKLMNTRIAAYLILIARAVSNIL